MRSITLFKYITICTGIFLTCFSHAQQKDTVLEKILATAEDQIILLSDLEFRHEAYVQQYRDKTPPANLKCRILEELLIEKMLVAQAEIDSVEVDESQVENQLDNRMRYFISQYGSEERLTEAYGKTVDELKGDLRKPVRQQLMVQQMQGEIKRRIKVTPKEVKLFFKNIPTDSLPYFSKEIEVSQIVKFPEVNKEQKLVYQTKLEDLKRRIQNGEDFAKLAEEFSEDPGSAVQGGELGFVKRGAMVPEFEVEALRLKENELSNVIESEFGFHLIQLIKKRGNEYNSRHILIKPQPSEEDFKKTENYLDSLKNMILLDSISFEKAAKEYSDDKKTSASGGAFSDPNTGSMKIPVENLDSEVFFIIDETSPGEFSKPVRFKDERGRDAVRIIWYKSKTDPHVANLKDDWQKIYNAALQNKQADAVSRWFEKTKNELFIRIDPDYEYCKLLDAKL